MVRILAVIFISLGAGLAGRSWKYSLCDFILIV